MFSQIDTTLHGVELQRRWPIADWLGLGHRANATWGGYGPIAGSEILPCIYNSGSGETKTEILRVDTAPHGVKAPSQPLKKKKVEKERVHKIRKHHTTLHQTEARASGSSGNDPNISSTDSHHSDSTPFTALLLRRVWDESGDPPIRYGDEGKCFRGYHLRPSLAADPKKK